MAKRESRATLAHILPLAGFLLFTSLPGFFLVENTALPWWRHAPEQWVYPLQTLVIGGMLFYFRKHYTFKPFRGLGLATLLGIVGIVLWLVPAWTYQKLISAGYSEQGWWEWLGLAERTDGFDPSFFSEHTFWYVSALVMRFIRMVVIVPLAEEIFWRGFLMRYVQADGDSFQKVPFGKHSWPAFGIVTGCFMIAHNNVDWVGALIFGSLMYWLAVRTKSLAACVLMHAVANLLLGAYVVYTRQWGFW
jgi:uncharacterized protein